MWVSSWTWHCHNRLWCLWSLFFTSKWESWSSPLNRMCWLLVLKWAWYKFSLSYIVNASSFTLSKFGVTIIFVLCNGVIISWTWDNFLLVTTHNSTCLKLWAHWPAQLDICFWVWFIGSWAWSQGSVFWLFIVNDSHGIFWTFNGLFWDLICTRSKFLRCKLLKLCSLTCSETPFRHHLLILFMSRCICSRSWNMFREWRNFNVRSLFFAYTVCWYHYIE
jgi:hypothetical protein